MKYMDQGAPLIVLAGKNMEPVPARDWRRRGRGSRVSGRLAESYERIHARI